MSSNLDLIVDVDVTRDTAAFTEPNYNSAMFVTGDQVFSDRYRTYTSASDLIVDGFDSDSATYRAVLTFFSQGGNVNELTVGRRDATGIVLTMSSSQVADNTDYNTVVQGQAINYNSGTSATAESILDGIAALITADPVAGTEVTALSTGSNDFTDIGAVETRAVTPPNSATDGYLVLVDTKLGTATDAFVGQDNNVMQADVNSLTTVDQRAYDSALLTPTNGDVVLLDSSLGTLAGDFSGMADGSIATYTTSWAETTSTTNDAFTVTDESLVYSFNGTTIDEGVQWSVNHTTVDNDSATVTDESGTRYIYDSDTSSWAEGAEAKLTITQNSGYTLTISYDHDEFNGTYSGYEDWTDALVAISQVYSDWYGLMTYDHSVTSILEIAAETEANYDAIYFCSNQNEENLEAVPEGGTPSANNIKGQLEQLNYDRTAFEYSATADTTYLECGYVGERIWTTPGASTWDFSQVKGVVADSLTRSQINILDTSANYFFTYGGVDMVRQGRVVSGEWIDTIRGGDNMASDVQIQLVRTLATTVKAGSKVPLTEAGMDRLKADVSLICENYVNRQFIKDTVSSTDGFGNTTTRRGYLVYSDPISSLTSNERASRTAPTIRVVADLAGAVNKARVVINLYV